MKNILSFFAIAALLFTACEKPETGNTDDPQGSEQIRLISSDVINVGDSNAMGLIQYEILEMITGAEIKAEADVEWIGNFNYNQQGKIQFNVEKNPDAEKREGNITITYDKSTLNVKVIQALSENPTNKEIKSPLLQGKYYGSYSGSNGLHNYYLAFTDLGMDASNNFYTPNAYYYFVDLYLDVDPNNMSHIQVPVGVYEFDVNNTPAANLFKDQFSWYQVNDESGTPASQTHYESGKLTVEEDKVTLEITLQIDYVQENHKVVYEGDWSLLDCTNEVYE
jgi:hypothetical protein